jgi:hypothetical protein
MDDVRQKVGDTDKRMLQITATTNIVCEAEIITPRDPRLASLPFCEVYP